MITAFIDVDSQLDFLYPSGALYVPGAERIVATIGRLNRWAAGRGIPVISTADAHAENDLEFAQWPPHCIAGTMGQHKAAATLLDRVITIPNRHSEWDLTGAQQIVVEKQIVDVFQVPSLSRVIDRLGAGRFVVYGVVTEICVLFAVRGLRQRGGAVTVVTDAIEALTPEGSRRAFDEMRLLGVELATAGQVMAAA